MANSFSARQARVLAIASQGLDAPLTSVGQVFTRVKCIQLDPLKAIRESHELVCLSRGVDTSDAASLLSAQSAYQTFTYPGHAMAILPMSTWPHFAFMRRRIRTHGWRGPEVDQAAVASVRSMLTERPNLTTADFADKTGAGWTRASPLRRAAEWLLWSGEAISTCRKGTHREYALAEKVVPRELSAAEPSDRDCIHWLVQSAVDALGIATTEDIADYFRLTKPVVQAALQDLGVEAASVEGWAHPAWISVAARSHVRKKLTRTIPLSPFDSLIWYRPRLARLFAKAYTLEAYKPADQRDFGHYFIPVLSGDAIIGRVSPRRAKGLVTIEASECDSDALRPQMEQALSTLTRWASPVSQEQHPLPPKVLKEAAIEG
jgi:uncharacterized protein YcaQ